MYRQFILGGCLLLALAGAAGAENKESAAKNPPAEKYSQAPAAKQLSGMSIVGNDDAPKSLYIVPWKTSEIGLETSLNRMLSESAVPVDREEFKRQLEFYEVGARKR